MTDQTEPATAGPTAAELTAEAVASRYPGLYQSEPRSERVGAIEPLHQVRLDIKGTGRWRCAGLEVHVSVSQPGHQNREEDEREVLARATVLVTDYIDTGRYGEVKVAMTNPRPEAGFPVAYVAADADRTSPAFASAVLGAVASALDYARATAAAAGAAVTVLDQQEEWERERPEDVPRHKWLREKEKAARAAARPPAAG
ncbi:hypothetical protein ACIOGZ_29755 [Kitasatospora sp. NPDC088160]|uniref:hypothetical protein n=1 Tax=Kitasatospora sp. NPDC088160 TaxID=3364072 RepID=UPI003820C6EA